MIEKKQQDAAFTVKTPAYIFHIPELKERVKNVILCFRLTSNMKIIIYPWA